MTTNNIDPNVVKVLPIIRSRSIWVGGCGAFLILFIFYFFYGGLVAFSFFLLIIITIFYNSQDYLLYHPNLPADSRMYVPIPTMHNLPHETISIHTPDKVTLHAFWVSHQDGKSKFVPTFVYFHGNAGNMGQRMQNVWGIFYRLHCNVLMVEYRGYGLSTGTPSEKGLGIDGRAAVDYLYTRDDLDHNQIVVFGRSLGGAVAIDVASDPKYRRKIMCTIVENTFTSIPLLAIELVNPYVKYFPVFCYKNKYESLRKIRETTTSFLFLSGMADSLVPPRMMRALYTECGSERKKLLEFVGGTHNDTWVVEGYYQGIRTFLDECQNILPPTIKPPEKSNMWSEIQDV